MLDKDGKFKKGTVYVSCRWPACAKGDGFRGYPKAWQVNGRLTLAAFKTNHTARHCPAMKILESLSPEELRQLAEAPLTESLALGAAAAQKIAAKGQAEEADGAAGGDEASGGSIKPISLSSSPVKGATGSVAFTVGPETVHACYLGPTFLGKNGTYAEQFVGAVLRHVVAKSLGDALEQCAILQGDYLRCLWLKLSGGRDFLRNCLDSAHATPQGPQQQAVVVQMWIDLTTAMSAVRADCGHSLLDIFRDKQLVFVQGTLDKYHHSLLVIVPEIPCVLSYDSCNPGEHSNELSLWYSMLTTAAYKHVNKELREVHGAETVAVPIQAAGSNNCGPATILFGEKVAGLYKDWISSEENSGVIEDLVEELRLLPLSPGAYDDARQEWEEIAHVLVKARGRAERRASLRRIISGSGGDGEAEVEGEADEVEGAKVEGTLPHDPHPTCTPPAPSHPTRHPHPPPATRHPSRPATPPPTRETWAARTSPRRRWRRSRRATTPPGQRRRSSRRRQQRRRPGWVISAATRRRHRPRLPCGRMPRRSRGVIAEQGCPRGVGSRRTILMTQSGLARGASAVRERG